MAIQIIPQKSNKIEGLGNLLNSGLSDISGSLSTLSERYANMRKQKEQQEHQSKLKELEYYLSGQQEQQKREYEAQQEQAKQRAAQEQAQSYYNSLYGNMANGVPPEQLGLGQQQYAQQPMGYTPNMPQEKRSEHVQGEPSREDYIRAIRAANISPKEGEKLLKDFDKKQLERERLAETQRGHDIAEEGQYLTRTAEQRKYVGEEASRILKNRNNSDKNIRQYEKLERLAKSGKSEVGYQNAFGNMIGIPNLGTTPESEQFDKIASALNLDKMAATTSSGNASAALLKEINKTNPSIFHSQEGKLALIRAKILEEKENMILGDELIKIRNKSKRKELDNDSIEEAYDAAKPEIEKLHEEYYKQLIDLAEKNGIKTEKQYYEPKEGQQESISGQLARNLTSAGTNVASGIAGVPSSILETARGISSLGDKAGEALNEYLNPNLKKEYAALGLGEQGNKNPITEGLEKVSSVVPGSERLKKEAGKALPEGYLEPRNSFEKAAYETAEDIGAALPSLIVNPVGGAKEFAKKLAKSNIPSNVAKFLARSFGAGEGTQDAVKAATMLMTSLDLGDSIFKKSGKDIERLKGNLPKSKMAAPAVEKAAENLENWATTGDKKLPSKKAAMDYLESFKESFGGGRVDPEELLRLNQGLSDRISTEYLSNKRSSALPHLYKLKDALSEQLEKWAPGLKEANAVYSQGKKAQEANDFLVDTLTSKYGKKFQEAWLNPKAWYKLGKTYGASIPIMKMANQLEGISSSPAYRKAWLGMMMSAVERNASGVTKNFERILKEEPKSK
jgi:hypothetical protein